MADEQVDGQEEGKKGGLMKIVLLVVGIVFVVMLTIGLTLYFTGFFDPGAEEAAEQQISALESEAAQAAEEAAQQPAKIQLEAPAVEKFETVYYELARGARNLEVTNQQVFSDCRSESERYAVVVPSHATQQLEWLRHHAFSGTAFARIA